MEVGARSSAHPMQGLLPAMRRVLCTLMGVGCCPSHISTAPPCVPLCLELRSDYSTQKAPTPSQVCVIITPSLLLFYLLRLLIL